MTLDELIDELTELRLAGRGDLTVVAEDGLDPSSIGSVQRVELARERFMNERGETTKRPCIRIVV